MSTAAGENAPDLQTLLDEVPSDRLVACVPTHESLILHDGERELGRIPLDGITEVSLADDSKVEKRYPLGRFMFLGPLALLFPRKTVREAYKLSIQWMDADGGYHFTHIRLPSRILANHTLGTIERARIPDVRKELAERAASTRERAAKTKEKVPHPVETSPFVTCPHCTMEFRRTDLPPGGRCPVCGNPL